MSLKVVSVMSIAITVNGVQVESDKVEKKAKTCVFPRWMKSCLGEADSSIDEIGGVRNPAQDYPSQSVFFDEGSEIDFAKVVVNTMVSEGRSYSDIILNAVPPNNFSGDQEKVLLDAVRDQFIGSFTAQKMSANETYGDIKKSLAQEIGMENEFGVKKMTEAQNKLMKNVWNATVVDKLLAEEKVFHEGEDLDVIKSLTKEMILEGKTIHVVKSELDAETKEKLNDFFDGQWETVLKGTFMTVVVKKGVLEGKQEFDIFRQITRCFGKKRNNSRKTTDREYQFFKDALNNALAEQGKRLTNSFENTSGKKQEAARPHSCQFRRTVTHGQSNAVAQHFKQKPRRSSVVSRVRSQQNLRSTQLVRPVSTGGFKRSLTPSHLDNQKQGFNKSFKY